MNEKQIVETEELADHVVSMADKLLDYNALSATTADMDAKYIQFEDARDEVKRRKYLTPLLAYISETENIR